MPAPALDLGIQTLGEAIQLTPASPARAVLTSSQNILQIINADKSRQQDERRLAQMVLDIAMAYSDGVKKLAESGNKDPEIERISDNLNSCLEVISKGLLDKPTGGFFTRIFSQSIAQKRLKGWKADLEHISLLLETQLRLRSAQMALNIWPVAEKATMQASMDERIQQANQEALDLIKSQVLKQTRKKLHKSSFGHFPPATSPIFFGRSHQVQHLVESLVQVPAYHAILGPGGMGKTSLGLNVLHDPRIVEVYGKQRYFLACETTPDVHGIIAGLADIFSLNERSFVKLFKGLCEVIQSNILFLLDNFETPWERKEARPQIENFLMELSTIRNLSIVLTLRGAERPGGIQWSRPLLPVLEPLELSAARQTFVAIADTQEDDAEMIRLLEEVESIPLAITLLAAQAPYTSCAFLLEQWKRSKTSMITRGWDSRLSSLDVSISLSLTSSRFSSNPQALTLLQILSLLPDGSTTEELHNITAEDFDTHKSISTLLQVALASLGPHDRLRVLAPIREYVQSKHPISLSHLQLVFSYHADLARYAMESEWTTEAKNMDDKLKACIGNIHYVIRVSLDVEPLSDEAIKATVNATSFRRDSRFGSADLLLEESLGLARMRQNMWLLAQCLRGIGVRRWAGTHMFALECLEESANILRRLSSQNSSELLVSTLTHLSWRLEVLQRIEEATQVAQEAVGLISQSTSPIFSALAYMRLGACLTESRNFSETRRLLERAGSYFNPSSFPELSLRLLSTLCRMYAAQNIYSQSVEMANKGLSLKHTADANRAGLFRFRGTISSQMNRYEDARRDFRESIQLGSLASAGMMVISNSYFHLGISYLACGDFMDAALSFHTAHKFDNPDVVPLGLGSRTGLAMLELYQNRFDESLICLGSDSTMSPFPPMSTRHLYRLQLQCQIHLRQRKARDALISCVLATVIAHGLQDMQQVAVTVMVLGDAFFFILQDVSASEACYQASLDMVRYLGNRRYLANALLRLGVTEYLQGNPSLAERRINQAATFYRETDGKPWLEFCKEILRLIDVSAPYEGIPFFPPVTLLGF